MTASLPRTLFVGRGAGAVCWYRCALPAMALGLEWVGVAGDPPELAFLTGRTATPLSCEDLASYEVVIVQQPLTREWHTAIRRLQAAGVVVLIEVDDDLHAVRKVRSHANRARFDADALRHFELNLRTADGVVCSTPFLARRCARFNQRIWTCRNGIDLKRYALARPDRDGVTVGWAGGTGHRDALSPWLPEVAAILRERANVRFATVGQRHAEALAGEFGTERCLGVPFAPLETYPAAMRLFDVALAPAGRTNFFRAKSDLRWLEASALGIPTVADPTVYPEVEHGVTGFHAHTPAEAGELTLALTDDAALRARVGAAAYEHVASHRRIEVAAQQWAAVLREAAGRRAAPAAA